MAKSKTNKDRKEKLENYKTQHKMAKAPEMKPFRQIPTWNAEDTFELSGAELDALYNFFNVFAPAFNATQQIFAKGMQAEKIKMAYEYEDGTPIPEEEIKDYTTKLNAYFKQRAEQEKKAQSKKTGKKILDSFGSPVEDTGADLSEQVEAEDAVAQETES